MRLSSANVSYDDVAKSKTKKDIDLGPFKAFDNLIATDSTRFSFSAGPPPPARCQPASRRRPAPAAAAAPRADPQHGRPAAGAVEPVLPRFGHNAALRPGAP